MNHTNQKKLNGKKETKKVFSVTLTPTLVNKLDNFRGFVSRSTSIQIIVSDYLENKKSGKATHSLPPDHKKKPSLTSKEIS